MDRKWQETPLAKVFTLADEYAAIKQRAQAVFVREALRGKGMKKCEWRTPVVPCCCCGGSGGRGGLGAAYLAVCLCCVAVLCSALLTC